MIKKRWGSRGLLIHLSGMMALIMVHFITDYPFFLERTGFNKYSPYLFLILFYGWIVFHNLILFDGLFLKGRKRSYFLWSSIAMLVSSFNMFFILYYGFNIQNPLEQIIDFWIFTLLGLGLYMIFRYINDFSKPPVKPKRTVKENFTFSTDGRMYDINLNNILYFESFENYVKIYTEQKVYLTRSTLKNAEETIANDNFLRISRYHIINILHVNLYNRELVRVKGKEFRVGNTYKKFVEDQLRQKLGLSEALIS